MPGRQRRHVLSGRHPEQRFPGYSRRDSGSPPSNQKYILWSFSTPWESIASLSLSVHRVWRTL